MISFLHQLPQNILGLIVILCTRAKWNGEAWTTRKIQGAVTLGKYIIIAERYSPADIKHEKGHQIQSLYLGWLYLIIVGLPSLVHAILHKGDNYEHFWTEKWADKLSKEI